jgi:hypothetical protein
VFWALSQLNLTEGDKDTFKATIYDNISFELGIISSLSLRNKCGQHWLRPAMPLSNFIAGIFSIFTPGIMLDRGDTGSSPLTCLAWVTLLRVETPTA